MGDADKLSSRIKELEAKLAEYEILEDDIADLSLYKEENARLRSELEKLKAGEAGSEPVLPAKPAAAANSQASMGEDIVAGLVEAVSQEVATTNQAMGEIQETGNALDDFASAMQLEKKMQDGGSTSETVPPSTSFGGHARFSSDRFQPEWDACKVKVMTFLRNLPNRLPIRPLRNRPGWRFRYR